MKRLSDKEKEDIIFEKVLSYYPDRVVCKLSTHYSALYQRIRYLAIKKDMKLDDYLMSLGFVYMDSQIIKPVDYESLFLKKQTSREFKMKKTDQSYISRLSKMYPDNVVVGLREKNRSLLTMIICTAKKRGLSTKEYFEHLGFRVDNGRLTDKEVAEFIEKNKDLNETFTMKSFPKKYTNAIAKRARKQNTKTINYLEDNGVNTNRLTIKKIKEVLQKHYPDKVVKYLYKTVGKSVYNSILRLANLKNMTVTDYLKKEMGYDDYKNGKRARRFDDEIITKILLAKFPDRNIVDFSDDLTTVLLYLKKKSKEQGITKNEYLKKLGFIYKRNEMIKFKDILVFLEKEYPDKKIHHLSAKNKNIYATIRLRAVAKKLTIKDYLKTIGYEYICGDNG